MALSQQLINEILITYQKTRGSPHKTAEQVGVSVSDVFSVVGADRVRQNAPVERFGGNGRPEMAEYLVARRKGGDAIEPWDNEDPDIKQARADYMAGTHEMTTGRDGSWILLYSIPRRRVAKGREDYFLPECGL